MLVDTSVAMVAACVNAWLLAANFQISAGNLRIVYRKIWMEKCKSKVEIFSPCMKDLNTQHFKKNPKNTFL